MANRQDRPDLAALAAMLLGGRRSGRGSLGDVLGMGAGMELAGGLMIGPDGVRSLSVEDILGGGSSAAGAAIEELRVSMIGKNMSFCDFGDYAPAEYTWTPLPGDVPHLATTARNTDNDDDPLDVHPWVLANVEPDDKDKSTDRWLLWTLCPHGRTSTCVPLKGDEARVKYLAGIILDNMVGRLDDEDLVDMLRKGRPGRAKKAKAAAPQEAPPATPAE
jgi:hypothetical protein